MKFKIEMNAEELARGIQNGVLQALVECDSTRQEQVQNMVRTTPAVVKEPKPVDLPDWTTSDVKPGEVGSPEWADKQAEVTSVDTGTGTITGEPPKPKYTVQKLALMGAQLCDQGKRDDILALLKEFGVSGIVDIPDERKDEYAARLIEMGASA